MHQLAVRFKKIVLGNTAPRCVSMPQPGGACLLVFADWSELRKISKTVIRGGIGINYEVKVGKTGFSVDANAGVRVLILAELTSRTSCRQRTSAKCDGRGDAELGFRNARNGVFVEIS
jgi:hypothetical protein